MASFKKKLKFFLLLTSLVLSFGSIADEKKKDSNEDREKEFEERVHKEVSKRIEEIKKKSLVEISKELLNKEKELRDKEREIKASQEKLALAEKTLSRKIEEFNKRQNKIIGCIDAHDKEKKSRINQLVHVVSNMKPNKAAELLSVQENAIAVQILAKIDPEKASKIFNLMDKEVSARLQKTYLRMEE